MINNFITGVAHAATVNPNTSDTSIEGFIFRAINALGFLIGAAILLAIVYSAFLFMTSAGNPDKVSQARRALLYALVAVVIIVLANIIVYFLSNGEGYQCLFIGGCVF